MDNSHAVVPDRDVRTSDDLLPSFIRRAGFVQEGESALGLLHSLAGTWTLASFGRDTSLKSTFVLSGVEAAVDTSDNKQE
jgi:hypothetical protein